MRIGAVNDEANVYSVSCEKWQQCNEVPGRVNDGGAHVPRAGTYQLNENDKISN
jgi:hypothetical protein